MFSQISVFVSHTWSHRDTKAFGTLTLTDKAFRRQGMNSLETITTFLNPQHLTLSDLLEVHLSNKNILDILPLSNKNIPSANNCSPFWFLIQGPKAEVSLPSAHWWDWSKGSVSVCWLTSYRVPLPGLHAANFMYSRFPISLFLLWVLLCTAADNLPHKKCARNLWVEVSVHPLLQHGDRIISSAKSRLHCLPYISHKAHLRHISKSSWHLQPSSPQASPPLVLLSTPIAGDVICLFCFPQLRSLV